MGVKESIKFLENDVLTISIIDRKVDEFHGKIKDTINLLKRGEVTRKNFYDGIRLCQEKGVRLYVQKYEYALNDEFIVYTETWETNPNPSIAHFLSDVSDEDFLIKLDKAIKLFWEHIKNKEVKE